MEWLQNSGALSPDLDDPDRQALANLADVLMQFGSIPKVKKTSIVEKAMRWLRSLDVYMDRSRHFPFLVVRSRR
jgi:hypothetical protein